MKESRRQFILSASATCAAALLPTTMAASAAAQTKGGGPTGKGGGSSTGGPDPYDATRLLEMDTFVQQLDTSFRVFQGKTATDLKLAEVEEFTSGHPETFYARFRGSSTSVIRQGTYIVEHHWLGRFALFLVPNGSDAKGNYFAATFNRATQ